MAEEKYIFTVTGDHANKILIGGSFPLWYLRAGGKWCNRWQLFGCAKR